ncbi:MAG TPA: hypothetical protein VHO06_20055 [Polyangia bacterium]|nr:hypothetical protein [Polyangia bacterium]
MSMAEEEDKLCTLVKIGDRRHIRAFFEQGEMYCQTIEHFAKLEDDQERGDADEGLARTIPLAAITSLKINGFEAVKDLAAGLDFRFNAHQSLNLFCMTAIRALGPVEVDSRCKRFGDSFLLLARPALFVRRVTAAAKLAGLETISSPVEYVVKDKHVGDMGPFKKFDRLAHQSEFRFVFAPGLGKTMTLRLGSLRDIAVWGPLEDLPKFSIAPGPGYTSSIAAGGR